MITGLFIGIFIVILMGIIEVIGDILAHTDSNNLELVIVSLAILLMAAYIGACINFIFNVLN